jgi:hypothetical protein
MYQQAVVGLIAIAQLAQALNTLKPACEQAKRADGT